MPDTYQNFSELHKDSLDGTSYKIESLQRASPIIILAVHAGGIEPGTSELARAIAADDFSLYLFEGRIERNDRLHITSTKFDEPRCLEQVQKHRIALSLHGFRDTEADPQIYLGGLDKVLIEHLKQTLNQAGYRTQISAGRFAARDPANICNRSSLGRGVQIEISKSLREQFFENINTRRGREIIKAPYAHFVLVVRNALLTHTGL